ncbi:hypothetical protein HK101_008177 [Irineochytrium annulatum]|nr:hypothetical protein HK101_008177 [Irineochytrium annulatum]
MDSVGLDGASIVENRGLHVLRVSLQLLEDLEPAFSKRVASPAVDAIAGVWCDTALCVSRFVLNSPPSYMMIALPYGATTTSVASPSTPALQRWSNSTSACRHALGLHLKALMAVSTALSGTGKGSRGSSSRKRDVHAAMVAIRQVLPSLAEKRSRVATASYPTQRTLHLPTEIIEVIVSFLFSNKPSRDYPIIDATRSTGGRASTRGYRERSHARAMQRTLVAVALVSRRWHQVAASLPWSAPCCLTSRAPDFLLASLLNSSDIKALGHRDSHPNSPLNPPRAIFSLQQEAVPRFVTALNLLDHRLAEPNDSTLLRCLADRSCNLTELGLNVSGLRWATLQVVTLRFIVFRLCLTRLKQHFLVPCATETEDRRIHHLKLRGTMEVSSGPPKQVTRLKQAFARLESFALDFTEAQVTGEIRNRAIAAALTIFQWLGSPTFRNVMFHANVRLGGDLVMPFLDRCVVHEVNTLRNGGLERLCLDRSMVLAQDVSMIANVFPGLRVLCLSNSTLGDHDLALIVGGCPLLEVINVSRSEVMHGGVRACGSAPRLREVYMDDLGIQSGSVGAMLAGLGTRLEVLSLHNNLKLANEILEGVVEHCSGGSLRRLDVFSVTTWGKEVRGSPVPARLLRGVMDGCRDLIDFVFDAVAMAEVKDAETSEVLAEVVARFPTVIDDAIQGRRDMIEGSQLGRFWMQEHSVF